MSNTKVCPYCREEIKQDAIKCRYCHSMLDNNSDVLGVTQITKEDLNNKLNDINESLHSEHETSETLEKSEPINTKDLSKEPLPKKPIPKSRKLIIWGIAAYMIIFLIVILSSLIFGGKSDDNGEEIQAEESILVEPVEEPEEVVDTAMEISAQMYTDGVKAFEDDVDYVAAYDHFAEVISDDPNYNSAQEYMSEAKDIIAENLISEVERLKSEGEYSQAEELLEDKSVYVAGNTRVNELKTEINELIEKQIVTDFKASCKEYEYRVLDKDAEKLSGEPIVLRGKVLQIMEEPGVAVVRLGVTRRSYGWSSSDVVYITHIGDTTIYADDIIKVYGNILGFHTYTSVAGYNITLPHVHMLYYEK